ncbi:uncharacterized protein LOC8082598 [Sorghum bicolor]|uniref:Uncharacterized protein n=1 Tax=Sorghum bicolor TaxID=4558 RepID=C5WYP2_SORBI|nr:uncharacterized protein LOC8082598 [Sorghum bicolor]EER94794.1 hypothetical protein SORBI_3001G359000 [Sorghum bicolor]|eukprot:XP_002467796.1 uncharacterized protein LOC8082598 [Sorghum bicolor]
MGLPLEQWRGGGGEAEGGKKKQAADAASSSSSAAAGCRTPDNGQAGRRVAGDCPAAPRKRRAPAGVVAQQQHRRDFYTGDDVEAFFAAHNL